MGVWHRRAVFYQIYPLSFQDTDGDGRGDLRGILQRIDHLSWLGVDAIWLGPVYPTPFDDFGYDISNYEDVDPVFGTLEDLDRLIGAVHDRGIKLVLDLVPNHTSSKHPWFEESRADRTNAKHDWYIWADPAPDGGPPSNWLSRFGGSAWEWEPRRGQYYYHAFLESQPDLNFRNPDVRNAIAEVMRFWLRRGVDGFRIDAAGVLAKDPELKDDPPNPDADDSSPPPQRLKPLSSDGRPECLPWLREMRLVADQFGERVLLGEVDTSPDKLPPFYGTEDEPILHLPLKYLLLDEEWNAGRLATSIQRYIDAVPEHGWPLWGIGGQDKKRIATRVGPQQARNAALMAMTLPGAPLFYAGDEIGMTQRPIPSERALDPFEHRVPGFGLNRDPERIPMQWDDGPNAGFTTGVPWLPVSEEHARVNVKAERDDPRSLLHLYRRLIALRKSEAALTEGEMDGIRADGDVLAYVRRRGARRLGVFLNLGSGHASLPLPGGGRLLLTTALDRKDVDLPRALSLGPGEGAIVALETEEP